MSKTVHGHGLTEREEAIFDAHERGLTDEQVGEELGIAPSYVRHILTLYSGSWSANIAFEKMVRAGTIRLAAAIAATGGSFA